MAAAVKSAPTALPPTRWLLYGYDISYFTGKLEAYLRYKRIAYERVQPTRKQCAEILLVKTGYMKVPVLHDRLKDIWLKDTTFTNSSVNMRLLTTSIIEYLEEQTDLEGARKTPLLPSCPVQRFLDLLLEDYADEWMWRPALHYRWSFEADRQMNQIRFTNEFLNGLFPTWLLRYMAGDRQLREYVYGDGIADAYAAKDTEQLYLDTLEVLESHLQQQPFLGGDRPSLADFGFMGSMFRHFSIDPTPATLMRMRAPAVYEWVARMWNAGSLPDVVAPREHVPATWYPLLRRIGKEYLPYLHANAVALRAGKSTFNFGMYKNLPAVQFRGWCRERLQERFNQLHRLDEASAARLRALLEETGCWEWLFKDGVIDSGLPEKDEYPICKRKRSISGWTMYKYELLGTVWNWPSFVPKSKL